MACMYCSNWKSPPFDVQADYDDRVGQCTLNPVWIETHCLHYCGQLTLSSVGELSERRKHSISGWGEAEKYKARALKAEASAKALREKLRAARLSTTVAEK